MVLQSPIITTEVCGIVNFEKQPRRLVGGTALSSGFPILAVQVNESTKSTNYNTGSNDDDDTRVIGDALF